MRFKMPRLQELVARPGLHGPFRFNNRIVYWDPVIDRYWDPVSEHYLTDDEIMSLFCFINGKMSIGTL